MKMCGLIILTPTCEKISSRAKCKLVENKSAPAKVRLQTTAKLARKIIKLATLVKLRSSLQPSLRSAALFLNVFRNPLSANFLNDIINNKSIHCE